MSENETLYTYEIVYGWKNDRETLIVHGTSHHVGRTGVRVRRDGEEIAQIDKDAYRSMIRHENGWKPDGGDDE